MSLVPKVLALVGGKPKTLQVQLWQGGKKDTARDTHISASSCTCRAEAALCCGQRQKEQGRCPRGWGQFSLGLSCSDRGRILKSFLAFAGYCGPLWGSLVLGCLFHRLLSCSETHYRSASLRRSSGPCPRKLGVGLVRHDPFRAR